MSLESTASLVADQIKRQDFVEVVAHHDADGIAAGSILCHAMVRAGIRFRLRVRQEITTADLTRDHTYLLCDLGAGIDQLPKDTIVVDHHNPYFTGEYHANPRLDGIDGDRELSSSGTAYIVAQQMGDNRDLAGLAVLGVIGDGQDLIGKNHEIFNEGVGNGIINPNRGLRLVGRDMSERWLMAINPYLDGISGDENTVTAMIGQAGGINALRLDLLLSLSVLHTLTGSGAACTEMMYGDTYTLDREVIPDAHGMAAVIDACGKTGHGDLGASICLRYSRDAETAWAIAREHRLNVITAIRAAVTSGGAHDGVYEIGDAELAGDVADALACRSIHTHPVAVIARNGDVCRVSARCPPGIDADLGTVIRGIAQSCGGSGGGHRLRAGATIPCTRLDAFRKGWHEAVAA
ncbi:MAG: DHHA1 domain-containing protein [Methanoregula sp.]|nr:DHHA1 domain-containing protein [Methanoregula sp.]